MKTVLFLLLSFSLTLCIASCAGPEANRAKPPEAENHAIKRAAIRTEQVKLSHVRKKITMTGQVALLEEGKADITAPIAGVIQKPLVKVGDLVSYGQPVAILNTLYGQTGLQMLQKLEQDKAALSQAQDNASQAKAEFANSTIDIHRKKELYNGGVASQSEVDDAEERYKKAESVVRNTATQVELAQSALERDRTLFNQTQLSGSALPQNLTPVQVEPGSSHLRGDALTGSISFYVRSPISGTVTGINATIGYSVTPGIVLASVVNSETVYIDANAYESDLAQVHIGDSITAKAPAYQDKKFTGSVRYIGKQVDPATRTVIVRSIIDNQSGLLRQGMFVNVTLLSARDRTMLEAPENAVLTNSGRHYVLMETKPGNYKKKAVYVGDTREHYVEIISGLKEGDRVVTDGNLLLDSQE